MVKHITELDVGVGLEVKEIYALSLQGAYGTI